MDKIYIRLSMLSKAYWPLLFIILIIAAALIHLQSTAWRNVYLYNGDSLTLALLAKSIHAGELFDWVFSSQLFLFPEYFIYGACYFLTNFSIQLSLVLNSIVNIGLLYALFYLIAQQVQEKRIISQIYGLICVSIVVLCTILEIKPLINKTAFVTLYLFNTYYYGVIIASLALIWLSLKLIKQRLTFQKIKNVKTIVIILSSLFVTVFTQFSDPLLLLQFSIPFLLTLSVLLLLHRIRLFDAILLGMIQVIGLLVGTILRLFFKKFIAAGVAGYIHVENIRQSIHALTNVIRQAANGLTSSIEYVIIGLVISYAIISVLFIIYKSIRTITNKTAHDETLLPIFFAGISPIFILLGVVATGNSYTRYLIPLAIFPLLSLLSLFNIRNTNILIKTGLSMLGIFCVMFIVYLFINASGSKSLISIDPSDSVSCFEHYTKDKSFYAIGSFWSSRSLDLYNNNNGIRILQAHKNLKPYRWLNNRAPYDKKSFNRIIIDKVSSDVSIDPKDVLRLGPVSDKYECKDFYIYYYAPGTEAHKRLNLIITSYLRTNK